MPINATLTIKDLSHSYDKVNNILLNYHSVKDGVSLEKMEKIRNDFHGALFTAATQYQTLRKAGKTTPADANHCVVVLSAGKTILTKFDRIIDVMQQAKS